MAETATIDTEREIETPKAAPEPVRVPASPASSSLLDVSKGLIGTDPDLTRQIAEKRARWEKAQADEKALLEKHAAETKTQTDAARTTQTAFADENEKRTAALINGPRVTQPPSLGLRAFLAPSKDETPEGALSKFMTAFGVLAAGLAGGRRGDARAALASLSGAMHGWSVGDKERADRAFADWKAQTDAVLKNAELDWQDYDRWFKAKGMTLEMIERGFKLTGLNQASERAVAAAESGSLEKMTGFLMEDRKAIDAARDRQLKIIEMHQQAEALNQDRERRAAETERHNREMESLRAAELQRKRDEDAQKRKDIEAAAGLFDDGAIDRMAQQYAVDGTLPPGLGRRKEGQAVIAKIVNRANQIAQERGETPEGQAMRRQLAKSNQAGLNSVTTQLAKVVPYAGAFTNAVDLAEKLSKKVDSTGIPVLNRWVQAGRVATGDPDVAAFHVQVMTVAREYVRATTGSVTVPEGARQEAVKKIDPAMTPEQFSAVADTLRADVKFIVDNLKAQRQAFASAVNPGGKPAATKATEKVSRGSSKYKEARALGITDDQMRERGVELVD